MDEAGLVGMADVLIADFSEISVDLEKVELPPIKTLRTGNPWDVEPPRCWDDQPTGPLLVWHHRPEAKRRVLWMIHYDTVYPPSPDSARGSSQKVRREDQKLIGPGVADAKGGIAVIALAIEAILKFDLLRDQGITIVFNPDEEIGSPASASFLQSICADYETAMLFEPSLPNGNLVAARKGSGNFAVHVKGRSAHAGRHIERGRNAIAHLALMVPEILDLHEPSEGITINIGKVFGGGALNQVPDHAMIQLNSRVTDHTQCKEVRQRLQTIAQDHMGDGYEVVIVGDFHCPPKPNTVEQQKLQQLFERAGQSIDRPIDWQDTGGACDGSKLAAWGLPNIDTLGVRGGDLHSPLEWMDLASLPGAAKLLVAAMSCME